MTSSPESPPSPRPWGYYVWPVLGVAGGLTVATLPFLVVPWLPKRVFGALPYMNTPQAKVKRIFVDLIPKPVSNTASGGATAQPPRPPPMFIDLGSGDGVAVIEAARRGYLAHGVELNPTLWALSRFNAWRAGVSGSTRLMLGNMWAVDLSHYDVLMVFGVQSLMGRLAHKLDREAKPGSMVVSYRFQLPSRPDSRTALIRVVDEVSLYRVEGKAGGGGG